MNSIYEGSFRVSQQQHSGHRGMDLVGSDSKKLFSNVDGVIEKLGWENPRKLSQGFGLRIWIKGNNGLHYVFGHMNYIQETLKVGDTVKVGDYLGQEGSTGNSTGSHCHFEIRESISSSTSLSAADYLGIDNKVGMYNSVSASDRDTVVRKCFSFSPDFWAYIDNYTVNGVNYSKDAYAKLASFLK